ncbi:cyclic peptide export ABC transporter [Desulfococcaceae bacterium HSG8]|nr:cyclic peptide export ABC transporter [Desulfococcaceae bacterium HSG8]
MTILELLKAESKLSLRVLITMLVLSSAANILLYIIILAAAGQPYDSVGRYFIFFCIALYLYTVFRRQLQMSVIRLVEGVTRRVRLRMLEKVRNADLYSLETMGKSEIHTAIASDIHAVSEATYAVSQLARSVAALVASLIYIAWFSWDILLFTVAMLFCIGLLFVWNQGSIHLSLIEIRKKEKGFFNSTNHLLRGFKELRLNNKKSDDFFHRNLKKRTAELKNIRIQTAYHFIHQDSLTFVLWNVAFAIIALLLPAVGDFPKDTVIKITGRILLLPLSAIVEAFPRLAEADSAVRELSRIEQMLDTLEQEDAVQKTEAEFSEIRYEDIVFQYTDKFGEPVFPVGPLNLTVQAGETLFIVGGNGSGKSTLLKLITGLYLPFSGRIYMDNEEIRITDYRHLFSVIFTDFHLFDRLYGLADISEERVNELLIRMKLDRKTEFTDGRFTRVDLSTGQKKRLALISSLLEDRHIFIFDEWAAGQDPVFKEYFYSQLLPDFKKQGKTVIAVTHDDRYFYVADRVLKMEYGQWAEIAHHL